MPNHFHGIIRIDRVSVASYGSTKGVLPKSGSLSAIIRSYKAGETKKCREEGYRNFKWQNRFYEHIIRNEADLNRIKQYIKNNVVKW